MHKLLLVARREYQYNLRRPAFLFAAFGTPLFFVGLITIVILIAVNEDTVEFQDLGQGLFSIGVVDEANLVTDTAIKRYEDLFTRYESVEDARSDLEAETLDAYTIIPQDYLETGTVQLFSIEGAEDYEGFVIGLMNNSLGEGLAEDLPGSRIIDPVSDLTIILQDTGREVNPESLIALFILPFFFGFVFTIATQITSGFLMSGLVDEKANNILEILVTSITHLELLGGKIIGLAALGLTQLGIWTTAALAMFFFAIQMEYIEGVTFPIDLLVVSVIYFLLGYLLLASLLAGLGSVVGNEQEGRQYAGFLSLFLFAPWFFLVQFIENTNGTLPTILSLVPFTAPMAMVIRYGIASVPLWQIVLSMGLMVLTIALVAWTAAKIFRWGMLMTGKRVSLKMIMQAITSKDEVATLPQETSEANA